MNLRPLSICIVFCTLATVVHADYRDAFRRGIQAARRGRWAEVAAAMREARAEEPRDTGERVNISGMDFVPYVPNYHLGLALYNLKDCVGALSAWQALEGQGGIRRVSGGERGVVAKFRKDCETRVATNVKPAPPEKPAPPDRPAGPDPAAVDAAAENASAAIARAQEAERTVAQLAGDELLTKVWRSEVGLGASEGRARDTLARSRNELEAGRRDSNIQRIQDAASIAATAAKEFAVVRQTAEGRRTQLANEAAAAAASRATEATREAPPASPNPALPPTSPALTTTKPLPFTPPPALASAARLFFRAQYAEAAASLSKQRYADGLAAGHAALFRAASNYALYLVGGEKDEKLVELARDAVREARRVAPALQPDPRAFSPRFIEFYRSTR